MRPPTPLWLLAVLLVVIPLLSVDNYFAYHAPGAIGSSIQSYFNLDEEDLASLFTVYSAPNIILVFLGGVFIDRFGLVRTSLIFNFIMLIGMIIFASAPRGSSSTLFYLLSGRFLLGVGGECICVCSSAMIARWFKRSSLTFAMGFNSALVQLLGSAPVFVLLPYLLGDAGMHRHAHVVDDTGASGVIPTGTNQTASIGDIDTFNDIGNVRLCLWVIVIVCAISLICNLIYAILDVRYGIIYVASAIEDFEREMDQDMMRLEMKQQALKESASSPPRADRSTKDGSYHKVGLDEVTHVQVRQTNDNLLLDASPIGEKHDHDKDEKESNSNPHSPSNAADGHSSGSNGGSSNSHGENSNLLDASILNLRALWNDAESGTFQFSVWKPWVTLKSMPLLFWLVFGMQCLLSPILYSFSAFGPLFFMEKYGFNQEEAGFLTSILYIAIILAPFVGIMIDRTGFRAQIQTVAAGFIPLAFILLHHTNISPYILMCVLGFAFAITESNGLAMIADVSPSNLLGTAYGVLGCGTSFFLLFEPYIVGAIHLHTNHYYWSTILFIVISFLGWFMSFCVYVFDINHDALMSESSRKRFETDMSVFGANGGPDGVEMSEQHAAYPALEIVFDEDNHDDEEEELFSLSDDEPRIELS